MGWVKGISISIIVLCLFIGGILFDIFVIKKYFNKDFGDSKDMLISQSVSIKKKIKPTTFSVRLDISGNDKLRALSSLDSTERVKITQSFNDIINAINASSGVCSGGSYYVRLQDYYADNTRKNGYVANMNIDCEFIESKKSVYDTFLNKVNSIVDSSGFLAVSIPPINGVITQEENEKYAQELQLELVSKIDSMKAQYEKKLNAKCGISNLDFNSMQYPVFRENAVLMSAKSAGESYDSALPVLKEEDIESKANIVLRCVR